MIYKKYNLTADVFNSELVCKIISKHKIPFSQISELNILDILNKEYNLNENSSKYETISNSSCNASDVPTHEVTPISNRYIYDLNETLSDISHDKHSEIQIEEFVYNNTLNFINNNSDIKMDYNLNFQFDFNDNISNSNEDFLSSNDNFDLKWFDVQCENGF
jgi:hypothetical protein